MSDRIVGLDIGYSKIRAAQVDRGHRGGARVDLVYEIDIPDGVFALGEVVDKEAFAELLTTLWSKGEFSSKKVALAAPNLHVFARELSIPVMSKHRIVESLPFMMEGVLPVPSESLFLDFYPAATEAEDSGPMFHGIVVAVEKTTVEKLVDAVTAAKLTPISVDFVPFALARMHLTENHEPGLMALVDVGALTSSVIIAQGAVPLFVRVIPVGGQDINRVLMSESKISDDEANKQKFAMTTEPTSKSETKNVTWKIINDAAADFAQAVKGTIDFFEQEHPAAIGRIEHVLLSGGGAQLAVLPGTLEKACKVTVELSRGIPHIKVKPPLDVDDKDFDKMAVAIGLTLGVN